MKLTIYIFILFSSVSIYGQGDDANRKEVARMYFLKQDYDSSLYYSNKVIKKNTYDYFQIGMSYFHLGNLNKAKTNLLLIFEDTVSKRNILILNQSSKTLAEIYFQEQDYLNTIKYLLFSKDKYNVWKCNNLTGYRDRFRFNYRLSQCYNQIGQIDSAIYYLTPYMFYDNINKSNSSIDSLEYVTIQKEYISMLLKRYSKSQLEIMIKESLNDLYYLKEIDTTWSIHSDVLQQNEIKFLNIDSNDSLSKTTDNAIIEEVEEVEDVDKYFYNIECSFNFTGTKVIIMNGSYSSNKVEVQADTPKQYRKETFIKIIANSYVYKELINE